MMGRRGALEYINLVAREHPVDTDIVPVGTMDTELEISETICQELSKAVREPGAYALSKGHLRVQ